MQSLESFGFEPCADVEIVATFPTYRSEVELAFLACEYDPELFLFRKRMLALCKIYGEVVIRFAIDHCKDRMAGLHSEPEPHYCKAILLGFYRQRMEALSLLDF